MQSSEDASHHLSLGETLQELLKADDENGISISEVARAVGEKGFGLLLVVLSLPSALPVPEIVQFFPASPGLGKWRAKGGRRRLRRPPSKG